MSENEPATTGAERAASNGRDGVDDPVSVDNPASVDEPASADARSDASTSPAGGQPLETLVRDGESVAGTCPYCDRPFATRAALDLHVGDVHADACSASEREAYADALAAEEDELFYFHLRVVAGLAALYTVLVLVYMVALGSGFL
ncbi:hypothetical protein [Halorubellus sp. PRR65]|uniref:DUF7410 domain-containing protein n=1 Tax=Halorubellus sp. PRR65 TaxID=3098148 RepID=UPI002B263514|nr:hypothetical protein [Halorubellus sp. PRR65]